MTLEGAAVLDWPRITRMQSRSSWTEADLVAACKAGRREAFEELVARHYDRILRLATVMAGPEVASDLAQETFLAALKALGNFRAESRLGTWLVSILRNRYFLHLRGQKKWKVAPLADETERLPAPPPDESDRAIREVLDRVKGLPEELRTALVLFYVDGMKYEEIAQAMECPIGTVRSRLFEARERLKKLMAGAEA